ncbi:hypothetical protein TRICI_005868 [Trichomonascus ciferrii]|uniref:DNA primase large subunit n=1 Tax=Trichomonascus ciferrii TaxID=44093 RepID=A0A642UNL3_9ASCO|nr:hypothetical protein TRICI_005868 [Trichomonascus ciferrii]
MFRQNNGRKRRAYERKIDSVEIDRNTEYPYRLNFYHGPPLQEITVEEFEEWAIDRLRVLNELELCEARGEWVEDKPNGGSLGQTMKPILDKYLPLSTSSGKNRAAVVEQERKKDHYSHFILRLVFSRSEDLRNRFIRLERELFKLRYYTDMRAERQAFIDSLNFAWEPVSEEERKSLETKLNWTMAEKEYFKLEFENVLDLVERRQVFLHKGKAYVPISLQHDLIFNQFTRQLEKALIATGKVLPRLDEDDRLVKILRHLADGGIPSTNKIKINTNGEFTADQVDALASKHFPMCMRWMHNSDRARHHAFYDNRTQYGLFLKGIGLSVEESLKFWRSVFNTLTDDQYKKQNYAYNVRHSYGLEGSRQDYRPKNCMEIIKATDTSKHCGCPFRGFEISRLTDELKAMGITDTQELAQVKDLVNKNRYHVACGMVYEFTHKNDTRQLEHTITSPNEYFERSFSLEKGDA